MMETKPLEQKSFGRFVMIWAGQLMSSVGNGMTAFALAVYVFQKTGTATGFAMIILCLFLPSILLRPVGGVLADRFDRRLLIVLGDLGSSAGIVFILISFLTASPESWTIYTGVIISSVFTGLQSPAYKALVTDLISEKEFSRAGSMVQLASSAQHLVSPLIAGLLLSISSIEIILMIDVSSFFIAVFTAMLIKNKTDSAKTAEKQHVLRDLKEGWEAVFSNKGVMTVIAVISLLTFFVGFLQTLFGPMVLSITDAKTLGIIQSVSATGMLLSSMVLSFVNITKRHKDFIIAGLFASGICFSVIGMSTSLILITCGFFLFFCSLPLINTNAEVLVRKNIPNEKQGRAWGIIGVLSQLGFVVAYSISGFLADNIFNPLLTDGGAFASTIGTIIGTGPGRGIGLILFISGICVLIISGVTIRINSFRILDNN